ncbi:DUF1553 domain-containing protein [Lignipirellula cremea]|nr:DUF1553 domain-containing protein [Lignipirellula cremea]
MKRFPYVLFAAAVCGLACSSVFGGEVDFNRDVRPILSNKCYTCHGPDPDAREAGLRLDLPAGALAELDSGAHAIVPGEPDQSELIRRIASTDAGERMPPDATGKPLSPKEIAVLTAWVQGGAAYETHWAYRPVQRREPPEISASTPLPPGADRAALQAWPRNAIDAFLLRKMLAEGLTPQPEADRYTLIRRASLDLTGLPPTIADVDRFLADNDPEAYEKMIDRLLAQDAYGEHFARLWLDLARYADSCGYADDPPRTIWAYRDWVVKAFNANQPFDQFTLDQLAGDLLPNPTDEQLIATAFHRNTLTNNEGGTNDEEFRNVAVVDRVNTTLAVWMGTTIACAQCHTHKFDPITQEDYFRVFAIFNNSEDADRRDESPLLQIWTPEQIAQKAAWTQEIADLEKLLATPTPELAAAQQKWAEQFQQQPSWTLLPPQAIAVESGAAGQIQDDSLVLVPTGSSKNRYTITIPLTGTEDRPLHALRLETVPQESLPGQGAGHANGAFVVTGVQATVTPPGDEGRRGRFVRVENLGDGQILSLAEVQVQSEGKNIAMGGKATQSSTAYDGPPELAIDGDTNGDFDKMSTTHTGTEKNPWWEVDLQATAPVDAIVVWNRTDNNLQNRLSNFRVVLLDELREVVWEKTIAEAPELNVELPLSSAQTIDFSNAFADFSQSGFDAATILQKDGAGWAVGPQFKAPHALTLVARKPIPATEGAVLKVVIEQQAKQEGHTLGAFRLQMSHDPAAARFAALPANIVALLRQPSGERDARGQETLATYYRSIAPLLAKERKQLASVQKQLAAAKPTTTVPIMRDLAAERQRTTHLQHRGNYLDQGPEVSPGLPEALFPAPQGEPFNRLTLARWLIDEKNPLTARVLANRYWEALFGQGLTPTSEEFGSQGEPPSHPELLDFLASEMIRLNWDRKAFVKMLATSAAYRQASTVEPGAFEQDPDNAFVARGPRFRLSAEMIRDQALAASGLLSHKMYGPPVQPPQPKSGLSAAFGPSVDWKTSEGEDSRRRALYTLWRRSNPYPSMSTFDAPNREVCTIRRDRTNTPLQALVTLNDPVYVEAAQALARRIASHGDTAAERATYGVRLCLARPPHDQELKELLNLYEQAKASFAEDPASAKTFASEPLGPLPAEADAVDLAAWTVVSNVLLNLDEMFLKR